MIKIQVKKDIYDSIINGEKTEICMKWSQSLLDRITIEKGQTKDAVMKDNTLVKKFEKVLVSCMFSPNNETYDLESITFGEESIIFKIKNMENTKCEHLSSEPFVVKPTIEQTPPKESIFKRVDKIIDDFCNHKNVYISKGPRVFIKPNGLVYGTNKRIPIKNDWEIRIDIEKSHFYFTYDITEDEYINNLKTYLYDMAKNNYVFVWKSKCKYMEIDGRRFVSLYLTKRRLTRKVIQG